MTLRVIDNHVTIISFAAEYRPQILQSGHIQMAWTNLPVIDRVESRYFSEQGSKVTVNMNDVIQTTKMRYKVQFFIPF